MYKPQATQWKSSLIAIHFPLKCPRHFRFCRRRHSQRSVMAVRMMEVSSIYLFHKTTPATMLIIAAMVVGTMVAMKSMNATSFA
jgi:hypothetical protein